MSHNIKSVTQIITKTFIPENENDSERIIANDITYGNLFPTCTKEEIVFEYKEN